MGARTRLAAFLMLAFSGAGAADAAELVMFKDDGCYYCERWRAEIAPIYGKTREGQIAPLRVVDKYAPRPPDLNGLGPIPYTPTFVLMEQGREIGRITGYPGADHFWGLLGQILGRLPR